jgi:alpha-glucosidase
MVRYYGGILDELHMAFNFSFLRQPWKAEAFRAAADLFESLLPPGAWPDYTLSNHDNPRARSRYDPRDPADAGRGERRARVGMLMLLTLRGTPFIYHGEEIGQGDGEIPPERVVDIAGRDPERTPMQWSAAPGAGFTTGEPWLPIGSEAPRVNVEAQSRDRSSMLAFTREALAFRRGHPALQRGSYRSIDAGRGVFAYVRETEGQRLLIVLEFDGQGRRLDLSEALGEMRGRVDLSTDPDRPREPIDLRDIEVGPDEGLVATLL